LGPLAVDLGIEAKGLVQGQSKHAVGRHFLAGGAGILNVHGGRQFAGV
jgi:hypothetical protein